MNLNQKPTKAQFCALIAAADDEAGHHVLWVDHDGQVNLTLIEDSVVLSQFSKTHPSVRLRFEVFCEGNGYVGKDASEDDDHVDRYFARLNTDWENAKSARPGEIFAD